MYSFLAFLASQAGVFSQLSLVTLIWDTRPSTTPRGDDGVAWSLCFFLLHPCGWNLGSSRSLWFSFPFHTSHSSWATVGLEYRGSCDEVGLGILGCSFPFGYRVCTVRLLLGFHRVPIVLSWLFGRKGDGADLTSFLFLPQRRLRILPASLSSGSASGWTIRTSMALVGVPEWEWAGDGVAVVARERQRGRGGGERKRI